MKEVGGVGHRWDVTSVYARVDLKSPFIKHTLSKGKIKVYALVGFLFFIMHLFPVSIVYKGFDGEIPRWEDIATESKLLFTIVDAEY